ncbi:hypothetical protein DVH05_009470 [Phytophthora capsici]|nr:hypothetical protein DVH05_009470 [Phytophthora capsici]
MTRRLSRSWTTTTRTSTRIENARTSTTLSPVVDALAVGVAPSESYDDLAGLLRRNGSVRSLGLGEQNAEESSDRRQAAAQAGRELPEDLPGLRAPRCYCPPH